MIRLTVRTSAATSLAIFVWNCAEPSPATVPDGIEPARPASDDCTPPYPMDFAQEHFFFADLDRNSTCAQFIEQDRCILGIFRDCVADDGQGAPDRQWAGRVETQGAQRSVQLAGTTNGAAVISRSPTCCEGALMPATGGPVEWSFLDCRLNRCGNTRDVVHAGIYFERLRPSNDPQSRILEPLSTVRAKAGPVWIESRQELWLLADGYIEQVAVDGSQPSGRIDLVIGDGKALIATRDAVFAAVGRVVTRIALPSLETTTASLGGPITLMTMTSRGLLVAFDFNSVENESSLALLDPDLALLESGTFDGQARHMAGLDSPNFFAVIARRGEPNLLPIASGLVNGAPWDFTKGASDNEGGELTVRDMVEGFAVPRWIVELPDGWIGFVDGCNDNVQTQCWFEVSEDPTKRPVRVGIPNAAELDAAWYDANHDRVVLGSSGGRIVVVDRNPLRPLLQDAVSLTGELKGLTGASDPVSCTATSTAYAYLESTQEIRPVRLTGLCGDG